jgi:tRNA-binding EMAP/Myf-like protein
MMKNRLVALITNVKPGKLRDVMSQGLVILSSVCLNPAHQLSKYFTLSHLLIFCVFDFFAAGSLCFK